MCKRFFIYLLKIKGFPNQQGEPEREKEKERAHARSANDDT